MTIFEMIDLQKGFLNKLVNNGVTIEDCRHIDLYIEYIELYTPTTKKTYVVALLAEKYGVCERTVHNIIKKFKRSVV